MKTGYRIHLIEFDTQPITDRLASASVEILKRLGAYVWYSIKSRLRYTSRISQPGHPPSLHRSTRGTNPQTSSPLLRGLAFGLQDDMRVNIGITMAAGKAGTAARALEEGGTSIRSDGKRITIRPRPFMRPAFMAEAMKAPEMWANSISN